MSGFHFDGKSVDLKIALNKIKMGPTRTSFPAFSISFVILSKDEALLLSRMEILFKTSDRVTNKSRLDLNLSQFTLINSIILSSVRLPVTGCWLSVRLSALSVFGEAVAEAGGLAAAAVFGIQAVRPSLVAGGVQAVLGAAAGGGDKRDSK